MRYIENCQICSPKECKGVQEHKRFFLVEIDDMIDFPVNLMNCPTLRKSLHLIPEENVQINRMEREPMRSDDE